MIYFPEYISFIIFTKEALTRFTQKQFPDFWGFFFKDKHICFNTFTIREVKKLCDMWLWHVLLQTVWIIITNIDVGVWSLQEEKYMCECVNKWECVNMYLSRYMQSYPQYQRLWQNLKHKSRNTNRQTPSCPLWIGPVDDLFVSLQITQVSLRGWDISSFTISYSCYMPEVME